MDHTNYGAGIIEPYRIECFSSAEPPEAWEPTKR